MGLKDLFTGLPLANFRHAVRNAPREVIFNRNLILSTMLYASGAIPVTWDQGSSSVVGTLPGFQHHFHTTSGAKAEQIREVVALVYIGYAVGSALSFFINDRIGRLWSFRLYLCVWMVGQMVAIFTPTVAGLYAARIISGLGIGPLTVIGPMAIVEIAPKEIRGLLTSWFLIAMGTAHFSSIFCVYGAYLHIPASRLQYQVVWFAPCLFMSLCIIVSFFLCESPRWLLIVGRRNEAITTLAKLRGLHSDHPRVQKEIYNIEQSVSTVNNQGHHLGLRNIMKETFTVRSNIRRMQQVLVSYALAQLSGANSITSYFVPIVSILSPNGDTMRNIFLSGMYGFSKFCFSIIASFFFIDALGRRRSLFVGTFLQAISDIYIAVYVKHQETASDAAAQGAIAMLFIHAFGYSVGLLVLPYVFGGELWPDKIRSFGGAVTQSFHWLFIYAMKFSVPSLLKKTDDWGAFLFFAAWCFIALVYVFLMVPEVAGLSVEEIEEVFKSPWFTAYRRSKRFAVDSQSVGAQDETNRSEIRDAEEMNIRAKCAIEGGARH